MFETAFRIDNHPNDLAVLEHQFGIRAVRVASGVATFVFDTAAQRDAAISVAWGIHHKRPFSN
jgi:hypothetical protein